MGKIWITTRGYLHFKGAMTGRTYHIVPFTPMEVEDTEIPHLDPRDYRVGKVAPPPPPQPAIVDE